MSTLSRHLPVNRYCMKAFSPVSGAQVVDFFVSGGGHKGYLLFLIAIGGTAALVPPYHFTLYEESRTKNRQYSSFILGVNPLLGFYSQTLMLLQRP